MFDFNGMYTKCQDMELPTSPGILWDLQNGSKWDKKLMIPGGHSFKAQQWLTYKQATDSFLVNKDRSKSIIETKFHRGEKNLLNSKTGKFSWAVDGYAESDQGIKIYEFLGDYFHKGCPNCSPNEVDKILKQKIPDLKKIGQVEIIWECEFDKLLKTIRHIDTPLIPHILENKQTTQDILTSISQNELYGFIICDISCPENLIESTQNFPPVIKRMAVKDKHLTGYMFAQFQKRYPGAQMDRTTVVQCFNATSHLLLTNLAQFYMKLGLEISNITQVIQYIPRRALRPFVKKVTDMRISGELAGQKTKANSAKIFGNSGYGKVKNFYFELIYQSIVFFQFKYLYLVGRKS